MADQRKTIRRKVDEPLIVFDMQSDQPIGQIINLSISGMMLMTESPVSVSKILYCRLPLPEKTNGSKEINFDAECKWCSQNKATGWYDSGYRLRNLSKENTETIRHLTHRLMIKRSKAFNPSSTMVKKKKGLFARLLSGS